MMRRLAVVLELDSEVFAEHARDNGWTEVPIPENDDEDRPIRLWQVPSGGEVRFVDETALPCQYVEITADDTAAIETAIADEFTCYDKQDCVEILDLGQPEETVCHALRLLACAAPGDVDQQVVETILPALADERENVRVTALRVPIATRWPAFLPEVTRLAADDPSDRVRHFATNAKLIIEAAERVKPS